MDNYKEIVNEISRINQFIGAPDLTKPIQELINNKNNTIYVAILGQFKAGKSSLINSLIEDNLLPIGVVPVTAIVTRIRFGKEKKIIIRFTNGKEITTQLEDLPKYVTEKLNPENIKQVSEAIIEHPALENFKNISLVDTPGLGSLYKHNTLVTQEWLPFTSIAIVGISAERPLAEEDYKLIKGIAQYCPEIIILITKVDLFNQEQISEIQYYIKETITKYLDREIIVLPYSTVKDTEKYRQEIINQVLTPLQTNAHQKLEEITLHKTKTIINQTIQYTELALQSSLKKEGEKEIVNQLLNDIRNNRHHHEREMLLTASSFKNDLREKLEKIILPFSPTLKIEFTNEFKEEFKLWKGNLFNVSRKYEKWLNEKMSHEIKKIDQESFNAVNQIVKEIISYYEYTAKQFRQRLDEKIASFFGTHLPETYWQVDFTGIDKPDVSVYRAFDSHLDLLLFFLPVRLFQKIFEKHFLKQIPYEIDKNLHRYISELNFRIFNTIDDIHRQTLMFISHEIGIVENIIQRTETQYQQIQEYLEQLKEIKKRVYELN